MRFVKLFSSILLLLEKQKYIMKSIFAALDTQYNQSDHISICLSLDLGPI